MNGWKETRAACLPVILQRDSGFYFESRLVRGSGVCYCWASMASIFYFLKRFFLERRLLAVHRERRAHDAVRIK